MPTQAAQQLQAIHTMLTTGHRNLRMEKHSLWLWGISGGLLFALSDSILTQTQLPDVTTRATSWLLLLAVVFGGAGIADWLLTQKVKAARDEVWSFIHRQIMKIWWLLMAIGSLLTFATFFFGGGYMVCSAWIILIGLGLFIHGLFSDEILEWAGGAMLIIGILALSFSFPYQAMKWIAASIFAIGMPALTLMINRPRPVWLKLLRLLAWILLTVLPPLLFYRYVMATTPNAGVVSLAAFQAQHTMPGSQIVAIPEGTVIPVHIRISGDVFQSTPDLTLPLTLAKPVEVVMQDGKPTRQVRMSGNSWAASAEAGWVSIPWIQAEMTPTSGPLFKTNLIINLQHQ
jgi:hypothetical protein